MSEKLGTPPVLFLFLKSLSFKIGRLKKFKIGRLKKHLLFENTTSAFTGEFGIKLTQIFGIKIRRKTDIL